MFIFTFKIFIFSVASVKSSTVTMNLLLFYIHSDIFPVEREINIPSARHIYITQWCCNSLWIFVLCINVTGKYERMHGVDFT